MTNSRTNRSIMAGLGLSALALPLALTMSGTAHAAPTLPASVLNAAHASCDERIFYPENHTFVEMRLDGKPTGKLTGYNVVFVGSDLEDDMTTKVCSVVKPVGIGDDARHMVTQLGYKRAEGIKLPYQASTLLTSGNFRVNSTVYPDQALVVLAEASVPGTKSVAKSVKRIVVDRRD